ncbi:MAG: tRNA (guanosine(37)-N1)-methyltransferase TrmD [Candidatus Moranbacteria bacterium RBG_19FT_COMBO_42_6]|nr:MAG: tRNA (guanosine(37)-N1)-methyltransferase TrmD [Candidatus Moranbacteria bacterium RBG_19FT_COMBO_42_6]
MRFDIITIFPKIFDSYFSESIIKRAKKNDLVEVKIHNLRDYAQDKHRTVDDTPYGGGAGMVMKIEPIHRAASSIISNFQFPISNKTPKSKSQKQKTRIILFSAKGKKFYQKDARRLSKYKQLTLICGRYEGVDERVAKHLADEEISIGDYVLTGGEIPAMVLVDSITRLIPGVLGNPKSLAEESFTKKISNSSVAAGKISSPILEYPQYTKPAEFMGWKVPKVLLSGDHRKIKEWREKNA